MKKKIDRKPSFRLTKGEVVYIPVRVHNVFTEEEVVNKDEGYYTVILPELLEFRFPQGSMPMAVLSVEDILRYETLKNFPKFRIGNKFNADRRVR